MKLAGTSRATHNLLSSPEWLGFPDSRGKCNQSVTIKTFVFRLESTIQELEILFSTEKGTLTRHPNTRNDMVLNKTTKRISRSRDEILIVCIGDHLSFGTSYLVLWRRERAMLTEGDKGYQVVLRGKWMFISRQDTN